MAKIKAHFFGKGNKGEGNCFPRAVANARGLDYDEAINLCIDYGYDNGMEINHIAKMARAEEGMGLGVCEWNAGKGISEYTTKYGVKFPRCTVKKLLGILEELGGRWIVVTRKHAFAFVEGTVYDNGTTSERDRVALVVRCVKAESSFDDYFDDFE